MRQKRRSSEPTIQHQKKPITTKSTVTSRISLLHNEALEGLGPDSMRYPPAALHKVAIHKMTQRIILADQLALSNKHIMKTADQVFHGREGYRRRVASSISWLCFRFRFVLIFCENVFRFVVRLVYARAGFKPGLSAMQMQPSPHTTFGLCSSRVKVKICRPRSLICAVYMYLYKIPACGLRLGPHPQLYAYEGTL